MPFLNYIQNPSHGITPTEQRALRDWYSQFNGNPALELIQRNMDRECDRDDIDHVIYNDYLRQLSWYYRPNYPDPTDFIERAYGSPPSRYLLPGQSLQIANETLSRCMRLDHLVKYNLQKAGIPISYDMRGAIQALRSGVLNGSSLTGSVLGQMNYPVWVSPTEDISQSLSAGDLRNLLGLVHIEFGHLVEISYPQNILLRGDRDLRAPTILDAIAKGAENWVFVKKSGGGGPDWGHTVNLSSRSPGVKEAVHSPFLITWAISSRISLRYAGDITNSPPQIDYRQLMSHT